MLGASEICYACLGTDKKELINVSKLDYDNVTLLDKLRFCAAVELEQDSLKHICLSCVNLLQISYKFRVMLLWSQDTLDKHKNEILSGACVAEFSLNKFQNISDLGGNTYLLVKQESMTTNNSTLTTLLNDTVADNHMKNFLDSDSSNCCFIELKQAENTLTSSDLEINGLDSKILISAHEYQCIKCSSTINWEDWDQREQKCEVCAETDIKDLKNPKSKRGRPKKLKSDLEVDFQCYHCSVAFNKRWKLQKHITKVHSDVKKYTCSYCGKGFKQSYHLREHLTSHTGERNYSCSFCDKTFQRLSSMRRHVRSHEAAPGQKTKKTPFLCTVCGKNFPFSNGVQRHMRIHLGIKNHVCTICSRRFTQSTHLHVHMRRHTGEKPYICDTCGLAFSLNASLQKHMSVHKQDMKQDPYQVHDCHTCKRTFTSLGSYNKHMKVRHKVVG